MSNKKSTHAQDHDQGRHDHDSSCSCGGGCDCGHDHDHGESAGILSHPAIKYGLLALSLISLIVSHMELLKAYLPIDVAWIALIHGGIPIYKGGITALVKKRKITSNLLMMIAIAACIAVGELFAAGEIAFIMYIGELLEDFTVDKANSGIKRLLGLSPVIANIKRGDTTVQISASEVQTGDILAVKPGETIPADGEITFGATTVDSSSLTGESMPLDVKLGGTVYAGTINISSYIELKAAAAGEDSTINRMIRMTREAKAKKAPIEKTADRMASFVVPAAVLISLLVLIFTRNILRAVTILVVFCPCALALATPTAIVAAIGRSAKGGVLIKSGDALEKMAACDTILMDKTGTITVGTPSVSDIIPWADLTEEQLIVYTASAENLSEHPLAKAVVSHALERGAELEHPSRFEAHSGLGITAQISAGEVRIGSIKYIEKEGIRIPQELVSRNDELTSQGKSTFVVALNGKIAGIVALSDKIRPNAANAVARLKKLGMRDIAILSGDNKRAVDYIAAQAGITSECYADCLPQDKLAVLDSFRARGANTIVVGDGINDAPILASADCGIAMAHLAGGNDIAIEAADIALMNSKIESVPAIVKLSKRTYRRIIINIALSMGINLIAVVLASMGTIDPVIGALFHNGGAIAVVLSSVQLLVGRD